MTGRMFPQRITVFIAGALLMTLVLAGCNLPKAPSATQPTSAADISTAAAKTVEALTSGGVTPEQITPQATNTPQATDTAKPAAGGGPGNTSTPAPTSSPTPACDLAGFIADLTIPDGSTVMAGQSFTKQWRLRNNGTCTWKSNYAVTFDSGDAMGAPASQPLGKDVAPNETVDISVQFTAPTQPGEYRSSWKLRNTKGVLFGTGTNNLPFFVAIKVGSSTPITGGYEFVAQACSADWSGNDTTIPCPGANGSNAGFVFKVDNPVFDTGYIDNEPALLMNPPYTSGGVIRGKFPLYQVKAGDHFRSVISCEQNAKQCAVIYELGYVSADQSGVQAVKTWEESYDNTLTNVDVDLSALAGKTVNFVLMVTAKSNGSGDRALWLRPRIEAQK